MKIEKLRDNYGYFSSKLSDISRQLCLAGIAVIWMFRVGDKESGGIPFDKSLLLPLGLFLFSLGLDFLHYLYGAAIWGGFARCKELKGVKTDDDFKVSKYVNWPTLAFFWGKVISLAFGQIFLLGYVACAFRIFVKAGG